MLLSELRSLIGDVLRPEHFGTAPDWVLNVQHVPEETVVWELFRGHLLDESQTRNCETFEAWHVRLDRLTPQPTAALSPAADGFEAKVLSIRLQLERQELYVVRHIRVHAWQAYESAPGVIDSRPVEKWMTELVGTLRLSSRQDVERLRDELAEYVSQAVFGTSRLPITSLESPLPLFALGELTYFGTSSTDGDSDRLGPTSIGTQPKAISLNPRPINPITMTQRPPRGFHLCTPKALEFVLRRMEADELAGVAEATVRSVQRADLSLDTVSRTVRETFLSIALSPAAKLVTNMVEWMRQLARHELLGPEAVAGDVAYLLRLLVRHLTAYDLVVFHNSGANYPDAYLLDALLKLFLELAQHDPGLYLPDDADSRPRSEWKLVCRRALRQAWLLRRRYEGHLVPDSPTSMGENQRVLPKSIPRVPDEQIADPRTRRKGLFDNEPAESLLRPPLDRIWQSCLQDFEQQSELRELGIGLFLDRPLGILKGDGEVDRTPLFSYVSFSRSIAATRLGDLCRWGCLPNDRFERYNAALDAIPVQGIPADQLPGRQRPGVVSLEDAKLVAPDQVFCYMTGSSRRTFAELAEVRHPASHAAEFASWLQSEVPALVIRTAAAPVAAQGQPYLTAFDRDGHPRWRLGIAPTPRYDESFGREYFANGLFVERVV